MSVSQKGLHLITEYGAVETPDSLPSPSGVPAEIPDDPLDRGLSKGQGASGCISWAAAGRHRLHILVSFHVRRKIRCAARANPRVRPNGRTSNDDAKSKALKDGPLLGCTLAMHSRTGLPCPRRCGRRQAGGPSFPVCLSLVQSTTVLPNGRLPACLDCLAMPSAKEAEAKKPWKPRPGSQIKPRQDDQRLGTCRAPVAAVGPDAVRSALAIILPRRSPGPRSIKTPFATARTRRWTAPAATAAPTATTQRSMSSGSKHAHDSHPQWHCVAAHRSQDWRYHLALPPAVHPILSSPPPFFLLPRLLIVLG